VQYSDVTSTLAGKISLTLQDQQIQMKASGDVQADGDIASGPCKGGPIQQTMVEAFRSAARPAITAAIMVPFQAISFLALNNLLFPNGNMVNMSMAYAPGDLVILGTFAPPA
jgi:hypothetical protein